MGVFDDLIPTSGNAFVDLIPPRPSTLSDIGRGALAGLERGAIGLAGQAGDVRNLAGTAAEKLGLPRGAGEAVAGALPIMGEAIKYAPDSGAITNAFEGAAGPIYRPQTIPGKYAQTAGEFLPGAALPVGGGMSLGGRLLKLVGLPALASETAGQLTEGTAAEPYARIGAAIAAPAAMATAGSRLLGPAATSVPRLTQNVAGVDVPLSAGQASGNVIDQTLENAALRGARGEPARQIADRFFNEQQAPAIENARAAVGAGLDRFGQTLVGSPQDAAEMASDSIRNIAAGAKQGYRNLYDQALSLPGEFHAATFEGVGQKIKGDLSLSQNPVIIDDVTTPVASRAIQHIDNTIGQLRLQNRADPFGQPNPENIVGVNLAGVDQARKQLISMAQATQRGSADHRAMSRIIGAFDGQVENGINNGLFSGDDYALDLMRQARDAYSRYRQTFTRQGAGDDVGAAMERILGRNGGDGATPNEVANFLYGQAKVGSPGLSVRLAQRVRNVLGEDSPEWTAVRQGLWQRLSSATEGTTQFGAQKSANRIGEFLNGSGNPLAQIMFSPQERQLMARYGGLQQQLIPKPGAVNYSNTGVLLSTLKSTANSLAVLLGAGLGGPFGALAGHAMGPLAAKLKENMAARALSRSLYTSQPAASTTSSRIAPNLLARGVMNAILAQQADRQRQAAPSF